MTKGHKSTTSFRARWCHRSGDAVSKIQAPAAYNQAMIAISITGT